MNQADRNKENQERGSTGEALITASLKQSSIWNYKLINAGYGTVADKLIIPPGGAYLIEIKTRLEPRIAYNKSSITNNERNGMDYFEKLVGKCHSYIIGIWKTKDFQRAFLIPWCQVRENVLSGVPGSIKMEEFPELKRSGKGWDLSCFGQMGGVKFESNN